VLVIPWWHVYRTVNLAPAQSHIWHMLCKIFFTIPLLASIEAYLAHHVSKKFGGKFGTCKAKYASHVTYCPSLEATLSHCVSYLTLCPDRFTVRTEQPKYFRPKHFSNTTGQNCQPLKINILVIPTNIPEVYLFK
jgi:hypothetical protein